MRSTREGKRTPGSLADFVTGIRPAYDLVQGMTCGIAYSRLDPSGAAAGAAFPRLEKPSRSGVPLRLSAEIVLYFAWNCLDARICPLT
jgi:hypothetical protein